MMYTPSAVSFGKGDTHHFQIRISVFFTYSKVHSFFHLQQVQNSSAYGKRHSFSTYGKSRFFTPTARGCCIINGYFVNDAASYAVIIIACCRTAASFPFLPAAFQSLSQKPPFSSRRLRLCLCMASKTCMLQPLPSSELTEPLPGGLLQWLRLLRLFPVLRPHYFSQEAPR